MKTPDTNPDRPDDAWDDLFRQRLADYTDLPPADALSLILGGSTTPRAPVYRRWAPVSVVVLLLIGTGGWLFVHKANTMLRRDGTAGAQSDQLTNQQQATVKTRWPHNQVSPSRVSGNRVAMDREAHSEAATPDGAIMGQSDRHKPMVPPGTASDPAAITHKKPGQLDRDTTLSTPSTPASSPHPNINTASQRLSAYVPRRSLHDPVLTTGLGQVLTSDRRTRPRSVDQPMTAGAMVGQPINPANRSREADHRPGGQFAAADPALPIQAESRLLPVDFLIGRPVRTLTLVTTMPAIAMTANPVAEPQASRPVRHPSWFASLTPLYNYQQINPVHTDAELVSDIRGAHPLAADRLGGRLQLGTEWQFSNRLRVRTSLVYQQVRQSLHYAVQSTQPDSVRVVVINAQSVQAVPIFNRRSYAETAVWHYAGLSADLVWQLNRRSTSWQHYLTAGATLGRYVSRGGAVNGFVQVAYGVERPLTPGLWLRIEPTVQLSWQALTDENKRLQSRPYGYGLALGLRFR